METKSSFQFPLQSQDKMAFSKDFTVFYVRRKKMDREIQEETGNQTKQSFYPPQQTCPSCWHSLWKHSRQLIGCLVTHSWGADQSFQSCACSGEQQSLINLRLVYHASMKTVWAFHRSFLEPQKNRYQTFHKWCSVLSHMESDGPAFDVVIDLDMRFLYWKLHE